MSRRVVWPMGGIALGLFVIGVCAQEQAGPQPAPPERVEAKGLENLYRVTPRLLSGGQPHGDAAFRRLSELGVKTILSVDGVATDVEAAKRYGMRYVHVPIGYDGIDVEQSKRILRAYDALPGPVYVHCHHGKHRGPTAVSVCLVGREGWTREQATDWMHRAGTDAKAYGGLYRTIETLQAPSRESLQAIRIADLPEQAETPAIVDAMVTIDGLWDHAVAAEKAGFAPSASDAGKDVNALASQVVLLREAYRELARSPEAIEHGDDFLGRLKQAAAHVESFESALRALQSNPTDDARATVTQAFKTAAADCKGCHAAYRDR